MSAGVVQIVAAVAATLLVMAVSAPGFGRRR